MYICIRKRVKMKFSRDKTSNIFMIGSEEKITNIKELILKVIEVFSVADLDKSLWLTDREKDFFVALVVNASINVDTLKDDLGDDNFNLYFGAHKKKERSQWLTKLKLKRWVMVENRKITIPPIFKAINVNKDKVEIRLKFNYEEEQG